MSSMWDELATRPQRDQLERLAQQRNWPLALLLTGWLHLLAFALCYYLTIVREYHEAPGYLAAWIGEFLGMGLIFRLCDRSKPAPFPPLARLVVRVWIAYFILAFNLCTMNTLRGHRLFEFFPAMASLASFAFLVLTFAVSRRFFTAVLVMFAAGLLMASFLLHAYLIFALVWWIVLNGIGLVLLSGRHSSQAPPAPAPRSVPPTTAPISEDSGRHQLTTAGFSSIPDVKEVEELLKSLAESGKKGMGPPPMRS